MGRYAKSSGGGNFTPAPAGTHVARCIKITDLGTQENTMYGGHKNQVLLTWELPNEMMEASSEGVSKPFTASKFYTNSLNEMATLRHDLEAWRGRTFTEEELAGFDLQSILTKPCMLSIVGKDGGGTKVGSVSSMPKNMECPPQFNQEEAFWLDEFNQEQFDALSDGLKTIIMKSPEYRSLSGLIDEPKGEAGNGFNDMEDDIPF